MQSAQKRERKAVLFIHGFMGSPKQFEYLFPIASAHGFFPQALLLPGHGSTLDEFCKTPAQAWQAHVHKELTSLRETYSKILLVGHSMGGLLAVSEAARDAVCICGLLAIAFPLHLKVSLKGISTNIRYIKKRVNKTDKFVTAAKAASGVAGISLLNSIKLLPNVMQLKRISALARSDLRCFELPLTLIQSNNDEWVSGKSASFARRILKCPKIVELSESGHFWYSETDKEIIKEELAALMVREC